MTKKSALAVPFILFILMFLSFQICQAIPTQISYQGALKDSSGNAVSNHSLDAVFSIYSAAEGGTPLWTESQSVNVNKGLYTVQLGSVNPIPSSMFDGTTKYLGITVGKDDEMTPRLAMVSVPYAYRANTADNIADGSVVSSLAKQGSSRLTGNVDIKAGSDISITQTGQTLEVAASITAIHTIGENYGGGIVFYIYDGGRHGLIAAPVDQSTGMIWATSNTTTGSYGEDVGGGIINTAIIIANQGGAYDGTKYAARACNEYTVAGYGDWYLPSEGELQLLNLQKVVVGVASASYWSSTDRTVDTAWAYDFSNSTVNGMSKNTLQRVRAVRAF